MKTNLFIWFLSVLIVLPINAQSKSGLYIDSYSGSAQLKVRGAKTWIKPTHKQVVARLDSVRVPEGAKMAIVDGVSGDVYPCDFNFIGTVNQFIRQAQKQQSFLLTELVKQLSGNALGKNKMAVHNIYGGATRTEEDEHYNDSIACLALATAKTTQTPYPNLTLRTILQNRMVHFIIDNATNKDYYVNVLTVNTRTGEVALCIVLEPDMDPNLLLLPAGQSFDLSMFHFLEQTDRQYILFATESPFVPAAIQPLLHYPEDLHCN